MKTKTLITVLLVVFMVAACAPASISTPIEIPVIPTATLTSTPPPPEPTASLTPTVEVKMPDLLQTKAAVDQFAAAMQAAGVQANAEKIRQGLLTQEIIRKDGKTYQVALTQDGYPLMVKHEGGEWKAAGYADLAPEGFIVGSGIDKWTWNFDDPAYKPLFESQFNLGMNDGTLAEDFYSKVPLKRLTPDEVVSYYKWNDHIEIEEYLKEKQVPAGLQNLFPGYLFTRDNPQEWIKQFSDAELVEWIGKHEEVVAAHTPNKNIRYVVVANEMFWHNPKTGWVGADGDYLFSRLGDNYIKTAFNKAQQLWPETTLILNDDTASMGVETNIVLNVEAYALFNYVKKMTKQGVPIEGFGLQNHLQARNFIQGDVQKNIKEYKKQLDKYIKMYETIGVQFYITELDVNTGGLPDSMTDNQRQELKAQIFEAAFDACLSNQNCKGVTTQGFSDASSWLNDPNYPYKPGGPGLPYDKNYAPVAAHYSILKTLFEADLARK